MSLPISGLVLTYNEEKNLPRCLGSLSFLDEVFVVDSLSSDGTLEICQQHAHRGVRVWQHPFQDYAAQRNWALENLPWSNTWVLVLDADERVSPELAEELRNLFTRERPPRDFYYVKRRFVFLGRWLKHSTSYPFWLIRVFRQGEARYVRSVNEQVLVSGEPGYLGSDLIHEDSKGLEAWIAKHNRYSSMEAAEYLRVLAGVAERAHVYQRKGRPDVRTQILKRYFIGLPVRPLLRFFYMYVWKRGFLDGRPGFMYCVLKAIQEFHISCKMFELRLSDGRRRARRRERPSRE